MPTLSVAQERAIVCFSLDLEPVVPIAQAFERAVASVGKVAGMTVYLPRLAASAGAWLLLLLGMVRMLASCGGSVEPAPVDVVSDAASQGSDAHAGVDVDGQAVDAGAAALCCVVGGSQVFVCDVDAGTSCPDGGVTYTHPEPGSCLTPFGLGQVEACQ